MCRVECLLCGNIIDVQCDYIKSGDTQSCGCLKSKGEQEVLSYLLEHNINHKTQYSFEDLLTPKGGRCYFDFAIFEHDKLKCLIEYQGEQHFHEMPDTPWKFGQFARKYQTLLRENIVKEIIFNYMK